MSTLLLKKNIFIIDDFKNNNTCIRLIGLEPIIFGTEIQRSIQLSYKRKKMIQPQTILKVADNSGAKSVKCIKVLNGFNRRFAVLSDIIIVSVQKLRNKARSISKVQKGEVHKAIIIRTKKKITKKDGTITFFQSNAVSLIGKQGKPIASRIIGPIPKKLKKKKNLKLITLSSGFI
jgi:large subunit ribosomal protein L14